MRVSTPLTLREHATPAANPATGSRLLYVKSDGKVYTKSGGVETLVGPLPVGTGSSDVAAGNHTHSGYAPTTHNHVAAEVYDPFADAGLARRYLRDDGVWERRREPGWTFKWWNGARTTPPPVGYIASSHATDPMLATDLYVPEQDANNEYHLLNTAVNGAGHSADHGMVLITGTAALQQEWLMFRITGDAVAMTGGNRFPVSYVGGAPAAPSWFDGGNPVGVTFFPGTKPPAAPTPDIWHKVGTAGEPGYLNGWQSVGTDGARFYKEGNQVRLRGRVQNGTVRDCFVLPLGYRPPETMTGMIAYAQVNGLSYVNIQADGSVLVGNTTATWVSLEGLSFSTT